MQEHTLLGTIVEQSHIYKVVFLFFNAMPLNVSNMHAHHLFWYISVSCLWIPCMSQTVTQVSQSCLTDLHLSWVLPQGQSVWETIFWEWEALCHCGSAMLALSMTPRFNRGNCSRFFSFYYCFVGLFVSLRLGLNPLMESLLAKDEALLIFHFFL